MPETGTINDLLDKKKLDRGEQDQAAQQLRENKRSGGGGEKKENVGQPANLGRDVNSQLMAGRQLREEQNEERKKRDGGGEKGEGNKKNSEGEEVKEGGGKDRVGQLKKNVKSKKEAEEKKEGTTTPVKQGTNWLLKASWLNIIDSFGLTLIYINMHVFLRWVFPNLFCKLGEEWTPRIVAGKSSTKNVAGTGFGLVEVAGLLMIDLIALIITLHIIAIIALMFDIIANPAKYIIGAISELFR